VAAAILAFPFHVLKRISGYSFIIIFVALIYFWICFAIYRDHEMIAWLVALPFFLTILFLYYTILVQQG